MILEIADIRIQPGRQVEFNEAVQRGITSVIAKAKGFSDWKVNVSIESPERYVLMLYWETLEDHTVGFRESADYKAWRDIVGPFFAAPPLVEHFNLLAEGHR